MTLYIIKPKPPTREEYRTWLSVGFRGSWDRYREIKRLSDGVPMFLHGDLGPHCTECASPSEVLCDYPVGDGKTCDRPLCGDHSHHVLSDVDYCASHFAEWVRFKDTNMRAALAAFMPIQGAAVPVPNNEDTPTP